MPTYYPSIPDNLISWILSQPLFFTATAPLNGKHINISPKGHPASTLRIPSPNQLLYLDATGSGVETISHLYENGRITIMLTSFGASPRILRLFCRGRVAEKYLGATESGGEVNAEYAKLLKEVYGDADGTKIAAARAIIVCDVWKVQTSCGYGVPIVNFGPGEPAVVEGQKGEKDKEGDLETGAGTGVFGGEKAGWQARDTLLVWGGKTAKAGNLGKYQVQNNTRSLDGLLGMKSARRGAGEWVLLADIIVLVKRIMVYILIFSFGTLVGMFTGRRPWGEPKML